MSHSDSHLAPGLSHGGGATLITIFHHVVISCYALHSECTSQSMHLAEHAKGKVLNDHSQTID